MKTIRTLTLAVVLIAILAAALPTLGADNSVTITEDQINSSYWVTNNPRRSVTNMAVDLQPDQALVSATITFRGKDPFDATATFVPSLSNGRIFWSVTNATANGQPASQELLNQINAALSSSWRNYFRENGKPGRVTGITITDTEVVITYAPRR